MRPTRARTWDGGLIKCGPARTALRLLRRCSKFVVLLTPLPGEVHRVFTLLQDVSFHSCNFHRAGHTTHEARERAGPCGGAAPPPGLAGGGRGVGTEVSRSSQAMARLQLTVRHGTQVSSHAVDVMLFTYSLSFTV